MSTQQEQLIKLSKVLKLPLVPKEAFNLAEQAERQKLCYIDYLLQLLERQHQEKQQRCMQRRIKEAKFPIIKTIEAFDFKQASQLPETLIRTLCTCDYIQKAEPIIFLGEPGTGKTHLAIALGFAACQQGYKVKFITIAELANELMEAKDSRALSKAVLRYSKPDVLILDEVGYLPLSRADAELIFQVLSQRQEHKPLIITTNLPFSEWGELFSDLRLCRAIIDRVRHRAHIIETGDKSIRFAETLKNQCSQKELLKEAIIIEKED